MKKNKTTRLLIFFIAALAVIAAAIAAVIIFTQSGTQTLSLHGGLEFEESASSWDDSAMSKDPAQPGIKVPGYGDLLFPADTDVVPLTLYNPKENNCNFVFELSLDNSDEPFFRTGLIPPGEAVTEIKTGGLAAGDYSLQMKILTYDTETGTPLNNAVVKTKLTVV